MTVTILVADKNCAGQPYRLTFHSFTTSFTRIYSRCILATHTQKIIENTNFKELNPLVGKTKMQIGNQSATISAMREVSTVICTISELYRSHLILFPKCGQCFSHTLFRESEKSDLWNKGRSHILFSGYTLRMEEKRQSSKAGTPTITLLDHFSKDTCL